MKSLTILLLLLISSISLAEFYPKPILYPTDPHMCTEEEKEPGVCSLVYKPVCGVYVDQQGNQIKETIKNRCAACKINQVKYVFEGTCSSYPGKSSFCLNYPGLTYSCAETVKTVCAFYNKKVSCLEPPCAVNQKNDCYACHYAADIEYYVPGECSKQLIPQQ